MTMVYRCNRVVIPDYNQIYTFYIKCECPSSSRDALLSLLDTRESKKNYYCIFLLWDYIIKDKIKFDKSDIIKTDESLTISFKLADIDACIKKNNLTYIIENVKYKIKNVKLIIDRLVYVKYTGKYLTYYNYYLTYIIL